MWTRWAGALADLFFPPHCAGCGRAVASGVDVCATCEESVVRVVEPRCAICSHPFDAMLDVAICPNCRGREFHFECAVSVMRSRGVVRELIHRFKYSKDQTLRRPLGNWLAEALDDPRMARVKPDVLAPVPLHRAREREREYNQAELLAEWVSRRSGIAWTRVLDRVRHTPTQTKFDRRQRMRNLRGAFKLRKNADVTDKHILLVDDVLTTGATLNECARVLLAGGADRVHAITLARG